MAERSIARPAIDWIVEYQPFVTTGAGVFPIGYLPIGAFPIGALPITGCGGGGWGCGRSAATAALSIPSDVAVAMRNFIPPPSITTDSNRLSDRKARHKITSGTSRQQERRRKKEPPGSLIPAGVAAESLLVKFGRSGVDM
jgi:hypothetical protein